VPSGGTRRQKRQRYGCALLLVGSVADRLREIELVENVERVGGG